MTPYNKPDKTAKRFRIKNHNVLNLSFWKNFILSNRQHSDISYKDLREVIIVFNQLARKEAIKNREGIELPEIGFLFIGSCKSKNMVDHAQSSEVGFRVKEFGWNTNNNFCKIFYNNYRQRFKLKFHQLWKFKGCRNFTQQVSAAYAKDWQRYIEIPPHLIISRMSSRANAINQIERKKDNFLVTYNEFDLNE